jgi:hypothetical protein
LGNSPILAALPGPVTIALLATLVGLLCLLARLLTRFLSALLTTLARLLALLAGSGLTLFGVRTAFFVLAHHCVSSLFKV